MDFCISQVMMGFWGFGVLGFWVEMGANAAVIGLIWGAKVAVLGYSGRQMWQFWVMGTNVEFCVQQGVNVGVCVEMGVNVAMVAALD